MTAIQAGARTIWAYSRDEMLPGSRIWYKIDKRTDTPIIAVWLFCVCCVCINLIGLGSYTAIVAIFNLTAIALDWSYCIPIICKLAFGKFERGPFHLGKLSVPINIWSIIWTFFVTIIYIMPTIRPVTPQNVSTLNPFRLPCLIANLPQMNYVVVLIAAVAIFSIGYWYAAGRHYYIGPRNNVQLIVGVESSDEKAGSSGGSSDEKRVTQ